MIVSFTLSERSLSLPTAFSYGIWIIGPIFAALVLFLIGKGLHFLRLRSHSHLVVWIATWAVFSAGHFLALWFGVTVLGSVGASETPAYIYLRWTALIAAGLTLLGQVLVVPWLIFVSKMLPRVRGLDEMNPGKHNGEALVPE